jgi:hypothetical protein
VKKLRLPFPAVLHSIKTTIPLKFSELDKNMMPMSGLKLQSGFEIGMLLCKKTRILLHFLNVKACALDIQII